MLNYITGAVCLLLDFALSVGTKNSTAFLADKLLLFFHPILSHWLWNNTFVELLLKVIGVLDQAPSFRANGRISSLISANSINLCIVSLMEMRGLCQNRSFFLPPFLSHTGALGALHTNYPLPILNKRTLVYDVVALPNDY